MLPLRRALALEKAVEETPEELLARESTEVNRFVGGALAELQRTVVELGGKVKRVRERGREGEERAAVGVVRVSDAACCSCIACLVLTHCPHTTPFQVRSLDSKFMAFEGSVNASDSASAAGAGIGGSAVAARTVAEI